MILAILHLCYYAYICAIFYLFNNGIKINTLVAHFSFCFTRYKFSKKPGRMFWLSIILFPLFYFEFCLNILFEKNSFIFVLSLIKGVNLRLFHITENY